MATIFDYNDRVFKEFSKFYGRAPKQARRATARMLTQFAFGTRVQAIKEIESSMVTRTKGFVKSSLRFSGAKPVHIDLQESHTFSIAKPRSTGFLEQQEGSMNKNSVSKTLLSRGNNFSRRVAPRFRLKSSNNFITENDFNDLPSGSKKTGAYIARVKRKYKNKPFLVRRKYKSIKKGIYIFKRKQMLILRNFEAKPRRVKKNPWMTRAREKFFKNNDVDQQWIKAMNFITRKRKF